MSTVLNCYYIKMESESDRQIRIKVSRVKMKHKISTDTRFFISNPVAKGEGLVFAKKLSNSISYSKGYAHKVQKNLAYLHFIL